MTTRLPVLHHIDGTLSCKFDPKLDREDIQNVHYISYPEVTEELMQELRNESTTPQRVRDILDSLVTRF
jgi:hypothetical protein